ncbi:hypothetical protein [Cylindrospermopsis raciborskii]|nr:hypothetical protein [Cylindrospermopsis raciborskii]MCZ2201713.1 hypothetical protein [Cylindrospermopsis raciborskii PAMP2012]MCZ2204988.1 hypothetical protein [Cylindrospermopsis raciborskii PAMP2011]
MLYIAKNDNLGGYLPIPPNKPMVACTFVVESTGEVLAFLLFE